MPYDQFVYEIELILENTEGSTPCPLILSPALGRTASIADQPEARQPLFAYFRPLCRYVDSCFRCLDHLTRALHTVPE